MKALTLLISGIALIGVSNPAYSTTTLTANLTNAQAGLAVVPTTTTGDPRPASHGTATFVLNDAMTQLNFTATVFNIDVTGMQTGDTNDNLVAAHIHAPGAPGATGPVVWGFFGNPDNDNNPDQLVVIPFASGVGGTFSSVWDLTEGNNTTLTAQLPNILSGLAYLNFHTTQFGAGEIRGQILPPPSVPEPSTWAMLLAGFGAIGLAARRNLAVGPQTKMGSRSPAAAG
jgi:hypothetical protein